jgi:hypothetical protein
LFIYFGKWFENDRNSAYVFMGCFFHGASNVLLISAKNGLGYILGDFFANSSGHPDVVRVGSKVVLLQIRNR